MFASNSSQFPLNSNSGSFQKMGRALLISIIAAASLVAPTNSEAAVVNLFASLNGPSENPANTSPGTGTATVIFDDVLKEMTVSANFSGLLGTTTAAHIHCCIASPENAGVATQTPSFSGFPLGVTSGTFNNTFNMTLAGSYNPAFITANGGTVDSAFSVLLAGLLAGEAYFNIHTSEFPRGEIRGFLNVVPLPPAILLFLSVLAGLGLLSLRRKEAQATT